LELASAGEPVLDGPRKARLPHLGSELLRQRDRRLDAFRDARLDALGLVQLTRDADPEAVEALGAGQLHGLGELDGGGVAGIPAGDDPVETGAVADGLRDRPDLVEAGREGDDAVARDGPVRGTQADDAAEGGRLLDRPARIGAERPGGEPSCDGGRGAARGAAGHARGVPGVAGGAVRRVLRGRAHGELVEVRLAEDGKAGLLAAGGDGRVEDGDVALEDA
jgi:hypothetical protein